MNPAKRIIMGVLFIIAAIFLPSYLAPFILIGAGLGLMITPVLDSARKIKGQNSKHQLH